MVYWNRNVTTSTFFLIKFFTLDNFVFQYFLHIDYFPYIYFHIYQIYDLKTHFVDTRSKMIEQFYF